MKRSNLKYSIGICIIIIVDSLHNIYFNDDRQLDLFLFFDYPDGIDGRYLDNILYDISNMFKFSILTYWLISINKRIFKPLFYLSLLVWVSYFTTYNQITSLFILPIYACIIAHFNKKNYKKWVKF